MNTLASEVQALRTGLSRYLPSMGSTASSLATAGAVQAVAEEVARRGGFKELRPRRARKTKPKARNRPGKGRNKSKANNQLTSVSAPLSTGTIVRTSRNRTSGGGNFKVHHREYLSNVQGATLANRSGWAINPGLAQFAPWMSKLAYNFEHYRLKRCRFEFLTNSATDRNGRVTFGFIPDNDVDAVLPNNQAEMTAIGDTVSGVVWTSITYDVQSQGWKLVRTADTGANEDLTLFDNGVVLLMVSDCSSTDIIGDVYIDYEFEFKDPILADPPTAYLYTAVATAPNQFFGSLSADEQAVIYGSVPVIAFDSVIYFMSTGEYLLSLDAEGDGGNNPGGITLTSQSAGLTVFEISRCTNGIDGSGRSSHSMSIVTVSKPGSVLEVIAGGTMDHSKAWIAPMTMRVAAPQYLTSALPESVRKEMRKWSLATPSEPKGEPQSTAAAIDDCSASVPDGYHLVRSN